MRLIHLLTQPQYVDWKCLNKGFKILPKGRVVWTDVHMDNSSGERRRVRVRRRKQTGGYFVRYVSVQTEAELIAK
jgi:hypothetical protein